MSLEATIFGTEGLAKADLRAEFDRAWLLNNYEQCTFPFSAQNELHRLNDFTFGNYLGITDSVLPAWGGFFDPEQTWSSTNRVLQQAYSGEKLFEWRAYPGGELLLTGTAGAIYRQIIEKLNTVLPWPTLIRAASDIYEHGTSRQETIGARKFFDDVLRISSRSGNDFWCEPIIQDGKLRFDAHWYARRGEDKNFALEEGFNIQAKDNLMEYQGEIWNVIYAYGNASTWAEREVAWAYDQASVDKHGPRMFPLAVDSNDPATVQANADAYCAFYKKARRSFNLTCSPNQVREDEAEKVFKTVRVGDTVSLLLPKKGNDDGTIGVNTRVRIKGMTHRGKSNTLDLIANEVMV